MMDLFLLPNFDCSSFKASLLRKFAVLEIVRMDDIVERFWKIFQRILHASQLMGLRIQN